jgi:hypothetical protein
MQVVLSSREIFEPPRSDDDEHGLGAVEVARNRLGQVPAGPDHVRVQVDTFLAKVLCQKVINLRGLATGVPGLGRDQDPPRRAVAQGHRYCATLVQRVTLAIRWTWSSRQRGSRPSVITAGLVHCSSRRWSATRRTPRSVRGWRARPTRTGTFTPSADRVAPWAPRRACEGDGAMSSSASALQPLHVMYTSDVFLVYGASSNEHRAR